MDKSYKRKLNIIATEFLKAIYTEVPIASVKVASDEYTGGHRVGITIKKFKEQNNPKYQMREVEDAVKMMHDEKLITPTQRGTSITPITQKIEHDYWDITPDGELALKSSYYLNKNEEDALTDNLKSMQLKLAKRQYLVIGITVAISVIALLFTFLNSRANKSQTVRIDLLQQQVQELRTVIQKIQRHP